MDLFVCLENIYFPNIYIGEWEDWDGTGLVIQRKKSMQAVFLFCNLVVI